MLRISVLQVAQVTVSGELDVATAPAVDDALSSLTGSIVVDGTGITFIDSAGFRAFDVAHEAAMDRGSSFVLFGLNRAARRTAEIFAVPYLPDVALSSSRGDCGHATEKANASGPGPGD